MPSQGAGVTYVELLDPLAPELDPAASAGGAVLPYERLSGRQFEQLCYDLLVAEGETPRFASVSGQPDFGADVILEVDGTRTIYQCKRIKEVTVAAIRAAAARIKDDWIGKAGLPAPQRFVYCCPQPIASLGPELTAFQSEFLRDTGIEVAFWDLDALDSRLRRLPDVVAAYFSDAYAETFCGADDWRDDPWWRVRRGEARHAAVRRFLQRKDAIYVSEEEQDQLLEMLDRNAVAAIRGLPGSGKTSFALEVACRLRDPVRRIYYATVEDSSALTRLRQSVRRRASVPAIFVLDDCHRDLDAAGRIRDWLGPELAGGKIRLLLVFRGLPNAPADLDDTPEWLADLQQEDAVVDLKTNDRRMHAVLEHIRPDLAGLSRKRLERLFRFCAGDLLLLAELLDGLEVQEADDEIDPRTVYARIRSRYFSGNAVQPGIRTLAALAQYELFPAAAFLDERWKAGELELAKPLMTKLFAPARYQFLHSSMAELVLHALVELEHPPHRLETGVERAISEAWLAYLHHLLSRNPDDPAEVNTALRLLMRSRLQLIDLPGQNRIKAAVFADERLRAAIETHLPAYAFDVLGGPLLLAGEGMDAGREWYSDRIIDRLRYACAHAEAPQSPDSDAIPKLESLSRSAPELLKRLYEEDMEALFRLFVERGTIGNLFSFVAFAPAEKREWLIDQLDDTKCLQVLENTLAAPGKVGTLYGAMQSLTARDSAALAGLERKIGAEPLLRVMIRKSSLRQLLDVLTNATPEFRQSLLEHLDAPAVATLIDRMIAERESIRTIGVRLRELERRTRSLASFEQRLGAGTLVRLIRANGTWVDLMHVLMYLSAPFREAVLEALDDGTTTTLIERTVARRQSIGTMELLWQHIDDQAFCGRLEQKLGAARTWALVLANGTLFELLGLLRHVTEPFRNELLDQLTDDMVTRLTIKTIASGRSAGTLNLALRNLRKVDGAAEVRVEQKIGAERLLQVLLANASIVELFRVLEHSSRPFCIELLNRIDESMIERLTANAVRSQRQIDSLHSALRRHSDAPEVRSGIEQLLDLTGWCSLIKKLGTFNSLMGLTSAMSDGMRAELIAATGTFTAAEWHDIIVRSRLQMACDFVLNELPSYPDAARPHFHDALPAAIDDVAERATWQDLRHAYLPAFVEGERSEITILRDALQRRLSTATAEELKDLEFVEMAHAVSCMWSHRADLRPAIAARFEEIVLGTPWPRTKGEIFALRWILNTATASEIPKEPVLKLLELTTSFLTRLICQAVGTRRLALLTWSIAVLQFERGSAASLAKSLDPRLGTVLLQILRDRVKAKPAKEEKLWLLILGGMLAVVVPSQRENIRGSLASLRSSIGLYELALTKSFIPCLFALEGLALAQGSSRLGEPFIKFGLRQKYEELDQPGPALEVLRKRLT